MINVYSIGFVCVAATALVGVDYVRQSKSASVELGAYPISQYIGSFKTRFADAKAGKRLATQQDERKARWRAGAQPYLPQAPQGWVRRSFDEGDNSAITAISNNKKKKKGSEAGLGLVVQMKAREAADEAKEIATRSWVYERDNEVVFVEIRTRQVASKNSLVGLVSDTLSGFSGAGSLEGYAVIGGVGFTESLAFDGSRKNHFRVLTGTIGFGEEIHLRVHANASKASTREILEAIDYDGLNSLLRNPMSTVGNDVVLPVGIAQDTLAEQMADLREEFLSLKAREAQYRIANVDAAALMINTYVQSYTGNDGAADLTGGKSVSMATLIDAGYREGMAALMEGRAVGRAAQEMDAILNGAEENAYVAKAEGKVLEPEKPEMSPELARELGLYEADESEISNMPGFSLSNLRPKERAHLEKNKTSSSYHDDGEGQEAARVMEFRRGLPPDSCVLDSKASKVWCNDNAEKYRDARNAVVSEGSGGFLSGLSSMLGFDAESSKQVASTKSSKKAAPKRLKLSGGTSCLGNSAGKFCGQ